MALVSATPSCSITACSDAWLLAGRDLGPVATDSTNRIGTPHNGAETTAHTVHRCIRRYVDVGPAMDLASRGAQLIGANIVINADQTKECARRTAPL